MNKKISDEQILEIRKKYFNGTTTKVLAVMYNVTDNTIRNIVHCRGCYKRVI